MLLDAWHHLQKHGSIDGILQELDKTKFPVPEPFPYKESHEFFKNPEVRSFRSAAALNSGDALSRVSSFASVLLPGHAGFRAATAQVDQSR